MPPRFDADALTLDLSVNDLLDTALLRHIGFGNRGGYERLWLGQAIHSHYQEEKLAEDPAYHREVVVVREFEHRGWTVKVSGRVDGLRRPKDAPWVVEEIKSVRRGATLSATTKEIYARQAQIYAWMLAEAAKCDVKAELVLIEIGGEGAQREEIAIDLESIDATIRRKVNILLRARDAEQAAIFARKAAGERLRFPYPEVRPGQEEIQSTVDRALENREHLLLQAPTGLGKTVAALYPALRYALLHDKRLFVLTAKTLQQEMATQVLARLAEDGGFKALRLRAKSKMCANDEVVCHEEYCRFAKDFYLKLDSSQIVPSLMERHHLLQPEEIFDRAKLAEVCPFEVSLEVSRRAQVVVCDYNYAFDPYVALTDFAADADLSDTILLIDEAHNLVDRGRGYYSPELDAGQARLAAERMRILGERGGDAIHFEVERACLRLAKIIEDGVSSALEELPPQAKAAESSLPEDALWALRPDFDAAFVGYLEWQRENKTFRQDDPFVGLYFGLLRFLNVLLVADGAFSRCVEVRDGVGRLRILCKDPSKFLGKTINRAHGVIAVSATLSPSEFYRDLLGFDSQRTGFLSVDSPFPKHHRRIVVDTSVTTTYAEREANIERIAQRLGEFTDAVPGNCLALFPSYDFLAKVAELLKPKHKRILVQRRADSDTARDTILATLRSALLGDVLLLAVAGGVFAEGVDYPGDVLRAVAVVGPCLPALTLDQELLKAYYDERFQRGFEFAFVVPGMTRVVQAAGRLIRSPKDQGVIALFDRRFLLPPYRDHLPNEWIPEEGAKALIGHPGSVAMAFFEELETVN
jgi:DNA excision repair protein ERCC-2